MSLRGVACTAAAMALLAAPCAASGQPPVPIVNIFSNPIQISRPSDVAIDPFSHDLFVSSRGEAPGVYRFKLKRGVVLSNGREDFDPGDLVPLLEFTRDGHVSAVENSNHEILYFDPKTLTVVNRFSQPAGADRANGLAFGFDVDVLENAGDADTGAPGSIFYGQAPDYPGFLSLGDTRFPNGVDLLVGTGPIEDGELQSDFEIFDAQNGVLLPFDDSPTPSLGTPFPGPPAATGATPGTDLSVLPIDVDPQPDGESTTPLLVPVPGQGQIYEARAPGSVWHPLLPAPMGRPVRVAADCEHLAWTDFAANEVHVATLTPPHPPAQQCDDLLAHLRVTGTRSLRPYSLSAQFGPAVDMDARVSASFNTTAAGPRQRRVATLARAMKSKTRRARLTAGRIKRVKLPFSRRASAAIARTLRRRHRVLGNLTIRATSPAGETTTIKHRLRLRAR